MMPTRAAATSLDMEALRAVRRLGTPLFCYSLLGQREPASYVSEC